MQLLTCLDYTVTIVAVDNEDDTLRVLEVMPPQGADLVLSTDIPHCELDVLVLDSLNVEACSDGSVSLFEAIGEFSGVSKHTDGGDRRHDFAQLELVQDGGFASRVQTDHQNAHLLLSH